MTQSQTLTYKTPSSFPATAATMLTLITALRVAQTLLAGGVFSSTKFGMYQTDKHPREILHTYIPSTAIDQYHNTESPSQINFLLFASSWTIFPALPYLLLPCQKHPTVHKFGIFAVEFVTMVFWFAGFIALAVFVTSFFWGLSGPVRAAALATITLASVEWCV